jgi:hypothetical protein
MEKNMENKKGKKETRTKYPRKTAREKEYNTHFT